jgi:hypothetical protein
MKVTSVVRSDDQPSMDFRRCAAKFPVATKVELAEAAAVVDVSQEGEDAAHLNGQDPHGRARLFDSQRLRIDSLGTLAAPSLHNESCASRQVTQNDIVVLAGERGTWQVIAPVNGSKADIRRREGFDIRVVTAVLESLTVVQYAGSPGCGY